VASIQLDGETMDGAKQVAPGWDPYFLEQEWRDWLGASGKEAPRKPDVAFIGFCAEYFRRRGSPL